MKFHSYNELIAHLKLKDEDYYITILDHSSLILEELNRIKKTALADDLGQNHQILTTALKYITAHNTIVNRGKIC